MRTMWSRIGLGAAAVFLLGFMLLTAAKQTGRAVRTAIAGMVPTPVKMTYPANRWLTGRAVVHLPFTLNGDRLGTVRRFSAVRAERNEVPRFELTVDLADGGLEGLDGCDLVPEREDHFDLDHGFRCARAGEGPWVEIGTVRFEPDGFTRPLEVSGSTAGDLAKGDPFEVKADLGGAVKVNARGNSDGLVRILADQQGAEIKVHDAMGRLLLGLLADSTGASLQVRDEKGREVVRMEAGHGGFSLTVDTAGVQ
jgi:hypothetical protein